MKHSFGEFELGNIADLSKVSKKTEGSAIIPFLTDFDDSLLTNVSFNLKPTVEGKAPTPETMASANPPPPVRSDVIETLTRESATDNLTAKIADLKEKVADKEITEYECAQLAMKSIRFLVRNGLLYYFKNPIYKRISEKEAVSLIKSFMPNGILRNKTYGFWKGVVKQIETTGSIHNDDYLPYQPEEIVFRNGVYNVFSEKMREATPEDFFLHSNDTDFNPNHYEDGKIVEEFYETFSGGNKEVQRLTWTSKGCILSQGNHFRKFFMLYGAPAAGKSLLGLIIEEIVSRNNCSHIPLNKIGSQFYTARLHNKQLNTCLDLSYVDLKDIGTLKLLTSGLGDREETSAKYGGFVTLETERIKMLFACNKLPRVSEEEYARPFYDRMVLIPFLHSIPPEKRDPMLKEKLLSQKNYIIKKALKHYKKLLKRNYQFPECTISKAILDRELGVVNTIESFVRACCRLDPMVQEFNDSLYESYVKYCSMQEWVPELYNPMIAQLRRKFNLVDGRDETEDGQRLHTTRGIFLKQSHSDQSDH